MKHLILTDSDLSTIVNALNMARDACESTALHLNGSMKEAFERSAKSYGALREKIEAAETIEVKA